MTFKMPTPSQFMEIGDSLGMEVTDADIESMRGYFGPFIDAYRTIGELPDCIPPVKYPRTPGYRPEGDENKWGAWLCKVHIKGAKSGPLAGKKVAIKDTYCIAGVPLTNGSTVLEGHLPQMDATVVTRLLDAGAEIVGKSVCEYFSYSGGAATSATGPVSNPRAPGHTPGGSSTGSGALVALGEVDMATGGDQAGSIRIPASSVHVLPLSLETYEWILLSNPAIGICGSLPFLKNNRIVSPTCNRAGSETLPSPACCDPIDHIKP